MNKALHQKNVLVLTFMAGLWPSIVMAEPTAKDLYYQNCSLCHDEDGAGVMPGIPDLGGADGPLWKPNKQLLGAVINGVDRTDLPIAMPVRGGNVELSDSQLQLIINYMRREFGGKKEIYP